MKESKRETELRIESALKDFADKGLRNAATGLLNVLGYKSDRLMPFSPNTAENFVATFDAERRFKPDQAIVSDWQSVDFLFQLTDSEIRNAGQGFLSFESKGAYDGAIIESYLFLAVALAKDRYTRTQLAAITRAVNRVFNMPVMLLFRHGDTITIAVIRRRLHKRDESKDVLEKVTLIKDIRLSSPHRAHIEILYDLSLTALSQAHPCSNFVELDRAWQRTLDTSELNKRFYEELANWYFWAVDEVRFFSGQDQAPPQVIRATNVIRLITRLIFIWFLREKGLVPNAPFIKNKVDELIEYIDTQGSTYYKAILQNLFFATLNQPMEQRRWRKEGVDDEKNCYRYRKYFKNPDAALGLFVNIPFLNGGLFDHLPQDQFSDRADTVLTVPDYLFFSDEINVDLNKAYGTKNRKYTVRGLLNILDRYKFTIDENTPVEEEIALDPELLGKVFENLLASYNPETKETARKLTGSYYTPREVVNYMVDECLKAYLVDQLKKRVPSYSEEDTSTVSGLLGYSESVPTLTDSQTEALVEAIHGARVLDPACGSGAFPMGILHKMVHILSKLDPGNERWRERQLRAVTDPVLRAHVEKAFDLNEADYGRKLYLIQNCIYGVDIQPIAVQIAKLRFFISLIVDQKVHPASENLGIIPLPNMETKFVAANTLIGLNRPKGAVGLWDLELEKKEDQLKEIREKHFNARTPLAKAECIVRDAAIRKEIEDLLKQEHWPPKTASKVANWDPYDVSASAEFFDSEWMFEVRDGFHITIGNPPYVRADSGPEHLSMRQRIIESGQYETLWEKWDLFIPFIEKSYKMLAPDGVSSLIVSDAYCHSKYAQKSQEWFLKNSRILRLDFLSKIKVFEAGVHNIVYFFQKTDGSSWKPERRVHDPEFGNVRYLPTGQQANLDRRVFFPGDREEGKLTAKVVTLAETCYVTVGMVVNADERQDQVRFELKDLVVDVKDKLHPKPFVEGKRLDKWRPIGNRWLEWGTTRAPAMFRRRTFEELYQVPEKLLILRIAGDDLRVCYDANRLYTNHTSIICVPWHSLKGVKNRSISKTAKYKNEKPVRKDVLSREELEVVSRRFSIKYLLAIVNSSVARRFLRGNRRSNTDLYPDDWKRLPIPDVSPEQQQPVVQIVDQILATKRADSSADVSQLEKKINDLVNALYGLSSTDGRVLTDSESMSAETNEQPETRLAGAD